MLPLLLVGAALAGPPRLAAAVGPVVGGGTSTQGSYLSAAPAGALSVTWPFGPFEAWAGLSGTGLMGATGNVVMPAALIQGELGVGIGGTGGGGGFYAGNGFPGPIAGIYGRAMLPGTGWARRMGVEARVFHAAVTDTTGIAVLFRVEPGFGEPERRRAARRPPPRPPPAPPPSVPGALEPEQGPEAEDAPLAIPAGAAPPPESAAAAPPPESAAAAPPLESEAPPPLESEAPPSGPEDPGTGGTHHDEPY